jgi:hypothetical protein
VLRFLKTPIELTVGATNYLNNLHAWLRRSTPPWLSIGRGGWLLSFSLRVTLSGNELHPLSVCAPTAPVSFDPLDIENGKLFGRRE